MRILAANRIALATVGLIFAAGPAICQTVGKTAAVNPSSTASGRVLTLGAEVVHKERIQTSESGSLQLLFLDRSTINIGPNSDVTIDEYIFDPNTNRGKMSVSIGKGLMRFVGGQISHNGNAVVKTPSATIGIRGAVGSFSYDPLTKLTSASNDCKDCSITLTAPNGQTVTIPPGHTATLGGDGKITLAPTPQDTSDRNLRQTQSKSGQTGGTDSQTAQDAANKDNTQFAQSPPPPPPPLPLSPPPPPPPLPPPPPPSASPTPLDAVPFAMTLSGVSGGNNGNGVAAVAGVPFLHPDLADGADPLISPVLGYRNAAPVGSTTPEPGKFMQYSLHIGNNVGSQDHWMVVAVGSLRTDGAGNNPMIEGAFAGTGSDGLESTPGTTQGSFAAPSGRITTNSSGIPTAATVNLDATYAPASGTAAQQSPPISFHSTQTATQAAVPAGLGNNRPAVNLQGYVGGVMRSEQLTGGGTDSSHFIVGNQNDSSNDLSVTLDPSDSSVAVDMKLANKRDNGATGPELVNANLKFGGGNGADPKRSAYVDYDNFAALDQRGVDGTTPKSTVDGLAVEKTEGYFINASPEIKQKVGAKLNVTPCNCEYTKWGFWSMTSKQTVGGAQYDDRGHMNLWVAGRRPGANDVPTSGEATYSGHVIANVRDGSTSKLAAAKMQTTVNFGAQSNQLNVQVGTNARKMDGAIYSGHLSLKPDRRDFAGTLGGNNNIQSLNRTMDMNGSFFRGKNHAVGEMGGSVKITGNNYMGGGIFAGKAIDGITAGARSRR